jgi:hypothetical protein
LPRPVIRDDDLRAIGGQEVSDSQHIIAKKTTSYELWNRVAGIDDSPGT